MTERENALRALKRQNPEWVPCQWEAISYIDPSVLNDRVDDGTDWFGVRWVDCVPDNIVPMMDDVTKWRDMIHFPDVEALDWEGAVKKDLDGVDREEKVVWVMLRVGLFERMHSFMGFENTLLSLYTEPEALKDLIDAYAEYRYKIMEKVLEYYKPDVVSVHDDYGTQRALFMSPDSWREFFKGHLKRFADLLHSKGVMFALHCCGKVDTLVGEFIEIGVDIWDSVQCCNDLEWVVDTYGDKLSFTPGLDMQRMAVGTPEDVRVHVRETIDLLGRYRGVIPHSNQPRVPKPIIDAISDEIEKYGKIAYQ